MGKKSKLFGVVLLLGIAGQLFDDDQSDKSSKGVQVSEVIETTDDKKSSAELPSIKTVTTVSQIQTHQQVPKIDKTGVEKSPSQQNQSILVAIRNPTENLPVNPSKSSGVTKLKPTTLIKYVDASRLNVRNGPGKSFKVVWTLKRDEKVSVQKTDGKWSYLKGKRYSGWVFSTYLTEKPNPPSQTANLGNNATRTNRSSRGLSDSRIRKILIERSKAYYSGSCPCPYNRTRSGRRCGRNSAYSKPGGASPLCYERDVTARMIANYRTRN